MTWRTFTPGFPFLFSSLALTVLARRDLGRGLVYHAERLINSVI
jgi:hypothetical protein